MSQYDGYMGLPKCPNCSGTGWQFSDPEDRDRGVIRCLCAARREAMTLEEFSEYLDTAYPKAQSEKQSSGIHIIKR